MFEYELQIKVKIIALPRRTGEINLEQVKGDLEQAILSYVNSEVAETQVIEITQIVGE
jgi:hypothetical protein